MATRFRRPQVGYFSQGTFTLNNILQSMNDTQKNQYETFVNRFKGSNQSFIAAEREIGFQTAATVKYGPLIKLPQPGGGYAPSSSIVKSLGVESGVVPAGMSLAQSERTGEFKLIEKPDDINKIDPVTKEISLGKGVSYQVLRRAKPPTTNVRPPDDPSKIWIDPKYQNRIDPGTTVIKNVPGAQITLTLLKRG